MVNVVIFFIIGSREGVTIPLRGTASNRTSLSSMLQAPEQTDFPATPFIPAHERDLGFGTVVSTDKRRRLLNRDGTFNVRRRGLRFWRSLSIYHWLLR